MKPADVLATIITFAVVLGTALALGATKPDCPRGERAAFSRLYSGWHCGPRR